MQAQWDAYRAPPPELHTEAPAPDDDGFPGCFSKSSTVSVQNKGVVQISEVDVRDPVLTASGTYQQIYALAHKNSNNHNATYTEREFLRIHTLQNFGSALEITGEHLIYVMGKDYPVRADSVQVGDTLVSAIYESGARVTKIETIYRADGLYAPMSPDGTIIVNGIVSSCYVALQQYPKSAGNGQYVMFADGESTGISQHTFAHMLLSPVRMACIGISSGVCDTFNDDGLAYFVQIGSAITNFACQQSALVQRILFLLFVGVFGTLFTLECVLGPTLSAFAIVIGLFAVARRFLPVSAGAHGHTTAKTKQL